MTVGSTVTPERAAAIALPTKRDEAWRYAPHGDLARLTFGPPPASVGEISSGVAEQIPLIDGPRIVIVNGVVDLDRSPLSNLPDGLEFSPLGQTMSEQAEPVVGHPGANGEEPADAFFSFNRAFGTDGAFIRVADGHHISSPIHVVDISIPGDSQNASCSNVVILLGDGSSATVVETHLGGTGGFGGSNTGTTITLGSNATLDHVVLQDLPAAQIHLGHIGVTQGAESVFRGRSFNLESSYGRFAYRVHLAGEGALADLSGLYFGLGRQTLDQQITVIHGAKDCSSRQSFRGVLDDQSAGVFNGGIDVRPGADGTDAEQSNDNLLLSNRAEVNTQPRLEILADDVACKHGATVGQLDDTALYYMRSRGIPAEHARRLLINGFADQAVDDVQIEAVRTWITKRLGHDQGLDGLDGLEGLEQGLDPEAEREKDDA